MTGKNKGIIFTTDLAVFMVIFLMIFSFSLVYFMGSAENSFYNTDLTFKEANLFFTGTESTAVITGDWYLCRDYPTYKLPSKKINKVCIGEIFD